MLKINKLCKVCMALEQYPSLSNDIYNSTAFMKNSATSLSDVHQKYESKGADFKYTALLAHCKRHQFMSEEDFNARHLRDIAKKAERQILQKKIESVEVWDTVIEKGMDQLNNGEIRMTTNSLLKAAKDKSDFEFKQKDQQLAMMEMVFHFASGEDKQNNPYDRRIIEGQAVENIDASEKLASSAEPGQNGPSGVYYPPSWDAAT